MNNPMMRGQGPTLSQYQKDLGSQRKPANSLDFIDPVPLAVLVQGKFPFKYQGQVIPEWKPEAESPGGGMPKNRPPKPVTHISTPVPPPALT